VWITLLAVFNEYVNVNNRACPIRSQRLGGKEVVTSTIVICNTHHLILSPNPCLQIGDVVVKE
jgi:hypothetical protein